MPLTLDHLVIAVADLDAAKSAFAQSKTFLFCNPHNPVGKVFTRREIENVAQVCLSSGTAIISDEIHCDLLFDGRVHVPIATLGRDVADRFYALDRGAVVISGDIASLTDDVVQKHLQV